MEVAENGLSPPPPYQSNCVCVDARHEEFHGAIGAHGTDRPGGARERTVKRAFFLALVFPPRTVEGGACTYVGFLPDGPGRL